MFVYGLGLTKKKKKKVFTEDRLMSIRWFPQKSYNMSRSMVGNFLQQYLWLKWVFFFVLFFYWWYRCSTFDALFCTLKRKL